MLTLDALRDFGADTREGLERCLNNEAMYLSLIRRALENRSFDALAAAVAADDRKAAFEAVHTLKGMTANLALTPLYTLSSEMTELLRAGADADYPDYLERLLRLRDALLRLDGK